MSDLSLTIGEGQSFTLLLNTGQGPAGRPPSVNITDITYDGSDRVTAYTINGVEHLVTYPDSTTIVDTGGGTVKTVTLDGLGRIISATVS